MTKIIVISGKKQSGKSTLAEFICEYWIAMHKKKSYKDADCKIYSFADPLKQFCINVMGLTYKQCYGSDEDKNSSTDIKWSSQPKEIQKAYAKKNRKKQLVYPKGYMTAREVMEVIGTQVVRKAKPDAWCRACYNLIKQEAPSLAVIADGRNPNEITVGTEMGAKAIRLLRNPHNPTSPSETALDNFPLGEYSLVVDNSNMSLEEKNSFVEQYIIKWFRNK